MAEATQTALFSVVRACIAPEPGVLRTAPFDIGQNKKRALS